MSGKLNLITNDLIEDKKPKTIYVVKPVPSMRLTRDFSSNLVIMTTVAALCSQTILQKSPNVSGNGP